MQVSLVLHPDSRPTAAAKIDVDMTRLGLGLLSLRYVVTGPVDRLRLASPAVATRTDDLWKHTCFEAFVRAPNGQDYCEFNFSPSSQWAAYRFKGYREGMTVIGEIMAPKISALSSADRFELQVLVDLGGQVDLARLETWQVGLSAVIEDIDGGKAYWALAHASGKPDFHHADGFACQLSVAERP